ncbi:unnamed protein product [Closterium sp. Naga37s-1]|nr:unnamed protein product [Closterium sp. Naga37s-1]
MRPCKAWRGCAPFPAFSHPSLKSPFSLRSPLSSSPLFLLSLLFHFPLSPPFSPDAFRHRWPDRGFCCSSRLSNHQHTTRLLISLVIRLSPPPLSPPLPSVTSIQTSFGTIGLTVGLLLLSYGFGAYFQFLPGSESSALMLTYGFPTALIGFALKYAELKPVPCTSYADAVALREAQATPILQQVRSDVTRFRYGDEQHLEEALKRIFRYNLSGGIQRRNAPTLTSISEQVYNGRYSLVLIFEAPALSKADFTERQAKFTSFFGPGVQALIEEVGSKTFAVRLVST